MRNNKMLLFVCLVIVLSFSNCGAEDAGPKFTCVNDAPTCGGTFDTCCSSTQCYYEFNGKRYNCDGLDCTAAATELAEDACGTARVDQSEVESIVSIAKKLN